jgi:hypothetical protein
MTKLKTSVTVDGDKVDAVRRITGATSTSAAIDAALTEFIRLDRLRSDVHAYRSTQPAPEEVALAGIDPDWSDIADDTDWESLYGPAGE